MTRIWILFCLLAASLTQAADFQSPRTTAIGGSGHGGPLLNDPIYLNPAFISFNKTYGIAFSFLKYTNDSAHGRDLNFSVVDGKSELFQAGVAYTVREDGNLLNVSFSRQILDRLSTGLGTKFFFNHNHTISRDVMVGAGGAVNPWLQLSLLGDNLFETNEDKANGFRREITLGTKWNVQDLMLIYADPHYTPTLSGALFGYESGLEFSVMSDLFLRVGMFKNSAQPQQSESRGNGWSAGLGWIGPRISLDYGYSRVTGGPAVAQAQSVSTHNIGVTAFF